MPAVQRDITLGNELLYDAVAAGMLLYTRGAFRVHVLGGHDERFEPGLMVIATHRAETDVPLLCPALYHRFAVWRQRMPRPHFAARDDLFVRGFFAGFPPGLPLWLRRLLYPLDAGGWLPEVRVHAISGLGTIKLAQALATLPVDTPLAGLLPGQLPELVARRARRVGRAEPQAVGDLLQGDFADLLWTTLDQEQLSHPAFAPAWQARAAAATGDLRLLVDLVREGKVLLLFPEGRPSPDGAIGPVQRGVGALIRRGKPSRLLPVGIAYDPLTRGRTLALVALCARIEPPSENVEQATLDLLRRAMPLTCGQVVAYTLGGALRSTGRVAPRELDEALAAEVELAGRTGRMLDPALVGVGPRRRRLDDALLACAERGLVDVRGPRRIDVLEAAAADPLLTRLALEFATARRPAAQASTTAAR